MTKYKQKYSIICSDIDLKSQMRPIAVPIYFQDCYIRYAAQNYFATFDLEPKNIYWFISEYNINFIEDLPFWGENFYVEIWISKISKLKVIVDFVFTHKNTIFAKGQSSWVLFNGINKKPMRTDVIFRDYNAMEKPVFDEPEKILWNNQLKPIRTIEHIANLTDLDFNGHVNNRSFVNIAITTATKEIQDKYYMRKLAVKFLKQAFIYNKLICTSYSTNQENEYQTNITVENQDVCKIYTAWQEKENFATILDYNLDVRNDN